MEKLLHEKTTNTVIHAAGFLNFNSNEINDLKKFITTTNHIIVNLHLQYTDQNLTWESLFPEWIDEDEFDPNSCPSLPIIRVPIVQIQHQKRLDFIAVKLPCKNDSNWSRDIARFHLQIAAAHLAVSVKGNRSVHLMFVTDCFPIPNLFLCDELVTRQGNVWLYKPNLNVMREKLQLPQGSCQLALPLRDTGIIYMIMMIFIFHIQLLVFSQCIVKLKSIITFMFLDYQTQKYDKILVG